ncbi:Vps51/Vps67-domain-containing protein [Chaetomium sp. MPI-CAGE-AT-0009]|nr:Vps51/Vps67-domain-containing protein [Chaetomium sp. MPI-CAGE-AT-0009]
MSTIASPRDRPGPFPRRTNSSVITPTSSSRPSLEGPASASSSPNPNTTTTTSSSSTTTAPTTTTQPKRTNRAALREYYNLRNTTNKPLPSPQPPTFDAPAYTSHLLQTASLADLLRTHARVLGEMRALDAERKALVYDNYSKLIAATDTIRRMRAARTPGDVVLPVAVALAGEGGRVAVGLREELRREVDTTAAAGAATAGGGADARRERTRELAREVVKVPERVRRLVGEGRVEEAKEEWERPRRLLVRWKELGVGGEEVGALIEEGDAALRGEGGGEGDEGASAAT